MRQGWQLLRWLRANMGRSIRQGRQLLYLLRVNMRHSIRQWRLRTNNWHGVQ